MGKALARLEDYDASRFNVLHPVLVKTEQGVVSPVLAQAISVVQIHSNPEAGDIYHDPRYAPAGKKGAPTAQGLTKIATAAGIQWDPDRCKILDRQSLAAGHIYVAFQAVGLIRQINGEWHVETATADIDTSVAEEEFRETYERKLKAGRAKYKAEDIPDMVRRETMQLKKFALRHAETKAKNRVIRRLLSLKQTYEIADLRKPFAVPRLLYRPDVAMAIEQGSRAVGELYGGSPGGPLGQDAPSSSLSTAEEPPRDQPAAGGVATGRGAGVDTGSPSEATPAGAELKEPSDDPVIEDPGQHRGERMSRVAEIDPGYLRGVAASGRTKTLRRLAQEWLDYTGPTQQSLGG